MTPTQPDPEAVDDGSLIRRVKRRFVYGLILGIVVVAALAILGDGPALLGVLGRFDWRLVPVILLLTLFNYVLRFGKWQLYLRWLGVGHIRPLTSFGIFLAGLSMSITPGKVGEFLKAYLLRRATRTPVAVSAPIIVAERISDAIAMLLLAALGLGVVHYGWQILAALAVVAAAGIVLLQQRPLMFRLFARLERLPLVARRIQALHVLYESAYLLFRPRHLLPAVAIGFVSWSGECVAFFLVLVGLGFPPSATLLITATFILATATLLGSVSMMPGGLGAAEASVAGLLLLLVHDGHMTPDLAAAATLLVRFATLWFGVLLGLGALLLVERHLARLETTPGRSVEASQPAD
ncbi:MAG TPA: lysylphosphatidylglycerol synthase transmembrane domain-containing protein [Thermomicrobiaceae bacterium]|nr:lysylphosphatidylglycerol synthase transmembrane domain-containing protein [Thermomicrobiaceae bacterium]